MTDEFIAHVRKREDGTWAPPHRISAHPEGKRGKVPHAIHGAELVDHIFGKEIGRIIAYCIAEHHAGLPDWSSAEGVGQASLQFQKAYGG